MKGCATSEATKLMEAMKQLRLAAGEIVKRAVPHLSTRLRDRCDHCGDPWPCVDYRLARAVKNLNDLMGPET